MILLCRLSEFRTWNDAEYALIHFHGTVNITNHQLAFFEVCLQAKRRCDPPVDKDESGPEGKRTSRLLQRQAGQCPPLLHWCGRRGDL